MVKSLYLNNFYIYYLFTQKSQNLLKKRRFLSIFPHFLSIFPHFSSFFIVFSPFFIDFYPFFIDFSPILHIKKTDMAKWAFREKFRRVRLRIGKLVRVLL
jgi:hypothetical protein